MKTNKYVYEIIVQGNYGYGWDDVWAAADWNDAKLRYYEYRSNERQYRHRIIHRRVPNPDYGRERSVHKLTMYRQGGGYNVTEIGVYGVRSIKVTPTGASLKYDYVYVDDNGKEIGVVGLHHGKWEVK